MSTYTQILYHIIYATKYREPTMDKENRTSLFDYMSGVLRNQKCYPYAINGVEDHLHIVVNVHPSIALANLVKDLKLSTRDFITREMLFPNFGAWQEGYGAFTYHKSDTDKLIGYVKAQEEHHQNGREDFVDEYKRILEEHGVEYDKKYLL